MPSACGSQQRSTRGRAASRDSFSPSLERLWYFRRSNDNSELYILEEPSLCQVIAPHPHHIRVCSFQPNDLGMEDALVLLHEANVDLVALHHFKRGWLG